MIIDNLKNAARYAAMCEGFAKGFAFIDRAKKENLAVGKYEIDGENVFAMVQEYDTKVVSKTESHEKYIDIQCILLGVEVMYALDTDKLTVTDRPAGKDVIIYADHEQFSKLVICADEFAIFYPGEGHKPGVAFDAPAPARKVVVKVKA